MTAPGSPLAQVRLPKIQRKQRSFNKNFAALKVSNFEGQIEIIADLLEDLQRAVEERQRLRIGASRVTTDGFPVNGEYCELLDGQYLVIENYQAGTNDFFILHGLSRRPQGMITVAGPSYVIPFIRADLANGIDGSSVRAITIRTTGGNAGDKYATIIY